MTRGRVLLVFVSLWASACVRPPAPVPVAAERIAVCLPNNEASDPLVISAGTVLEGSIFTTDRITVPDVLAAEARTQLAQRGFVVAAAVDGHAPTSPADAVSSAASTQADGAVLYTVIRQWEPDNRSQPRAVIVALEVSLLNLRDGHLLWTATHSARPVRTEGAIGLGEAYSIAARAVMEELLAPLTPARTG